MSDDGGVGEALGCLLTGFLGYWILKIGCLFPALVLVLLLESAMHLFSG